MAKRFPFRTAIAGVTTLAIAAPVIAPMDFTVLSAAVAHAQQVITVSGPDTISINTAGEFTANIPGATAGEVQFYLDGVPVEGTATVGQGGIATKSITPTTFATTGAPHTVTARYIDGQGFNPNPDGTVTFTTPVMNESIVVGDREYDEYSGFKVGQTSTALAVSSLEDPVIIEPGSEYTIRGTMKVAGGFSEIYETGFNAPSTTTYKSMVRYGDSYQVVGVGTGTGTQRNLKSGRTYKHPSWGTGGYPSVGIGYVGQQHPKTYKASNGTIYDLQATFVAPTTPGVYVPQFASYKYGSDTHALQRMDEAAFRVPAQKIPDRVEPTGPAAADTTITLSGDTTKKDNENAKVTATIAPEGATGSVRFFADNTPLTAAPVAVVDGKAVLDRKFEPGVYEIRAEFAPEDATKFNASATAAPHTLTVNASQFDTTTTLELPATGEKGKETQLKATVAPVAAQGSPEKVTTGKVEFYQGNNKIAEADVNDQGVATANHTFENDGTQTLTARYVKTDEFNASTSNEASILITSETTTTLTVSNENPTVNTPVTLTATVTPPLAAGTVEFWDKDTNTKLGEGTVKDATATFQYTPTDTKAHNIEARFVPTGGVNKPSTSDAVTVTAKKYETTVAVGAGQSFTTGQPGALTATVSPNNAAGKIVFTDGNRTLGEAPVENGTATLPNATFAEAGTPQITATFVPAENSNFAENTGTGQVTVTKAAVETTTTLTGNISVPAGEQATLTATVNAQDSSQAAGQVRFLEGDTELAVVDVVDGKAELNRQFAAGEHTVRAEFVPSDAAYRPSSSDALTFTVASAAVSTTTAFDPQAPKEFVRGTKNDMVANVTDGNGNPVTTGWVRFTLDGTALNPLIALNGEGKAVYDKTFGTEGTNQLVMEYVPPVGSNLEPSRSDEVTLTTKTATTTSLSVNNTSPRAGTAVTLTATIEPKETAGTVHFFEVDAQGNETKIGEATPVKTGNFFNSSWTATRSYTPATPGEKKVIARFVPTGQYVSGSEASATLNVQANSASLSLVDSQPFTTGQAGSLSARIIPNTAPGEIEFFDGQKSLGKAPIEGGIATLNNVSFDTAGDKTITVKYVPSANSTYAAQDATGTVTVKDPAGASTVTLTGPATATAGDEVTLTATPGPAGAAGQVRFFEGDTELATVDVVDGKAELKHTFDTAGNHVIGAEFIPAPEANLNRSAPAFHTIAVERAMVDTTVAYAGPTTSPAGTKLYMLAEVKDAEGNPVTEGQVRFMLDGQQIGQPQPATTTGQYAGKFVFDKTFNLARVENLTLEYLPPAGSQYNGSKSTETTEILIQGTTTTSLSASTTTPAVGTPVTLTANVDPQSVGGTVEFYDVTDPANEAKVGEATPDSSGRASVEFTPDSTAERTFEARLTPTGNIYTGSKSTTVTVKPTAIGTTVTLNPNQTFTAGQPGTLTANVSPDNQPGTVEFFRGNSTAPADKIGEAQVTDGTATLNDATFATAGNPVVTVRFTPDNANYKQSQNTTGTVTVVPAAVDTALNLTGPATATEGDEVTLTATVDPAATGKVHFFEGNNELASVDVAGGKAELTREFAPGNHTVRAEFVPANAAEFNPSKTTDDHVFNVTAKSTVTLAEGQTFTATEAGPLSARVAPASATGSVEFFLGNDSLGTADVNNGIATVPNATFPTAGEQTVRVVFSPAADSNFAKSETTGTVTVNEQKVAAQTNITLSGPATSNTDDDVTITAKVNPLNAAGTVQFFDNGKVVGTEQDAVNGEAQLTQKFAEGTHNITAKFTPTDATDFTESTSTAHKLTVEQAKVDTTVAFNGQPEASAGVKYDIVANVTAADGTPVNDGEVEFTVDGTTLSPRIKVTNGKAVYDKTFNTEGERTVTLKYFPAANSKLNPSASTTEGKFNVTLRETTTKLTASNTAPAVGTPIFLTATVTPGVSGSVEFYDVTDAQNPVKISGPTTVSNAKATAQYTPKTLGDKKIEARFKPATASATYAPSTSEQLTISPKALTATVGLIEGQTFTVGQANNLTASVFPNNAAGTIEFFDGDTSLGTADVNNGSATKNGVTFDAPAESKTITVKFTPADGSNFAPQETTGTVKVVKAAENTTVTLTGPANATDGEEVTITADVAPADATGRVRFFEGNNELATVDVTNGKAELTRSFAAGKHEVRAEFLPANTADYNGSQTTANHVIDVAEAKVATTITYTGPTEGNQGEKLWMKAKVTPNTGNEVINDGTVIFKLDGQQIGQPQPVRNGEATFDKTFTEAKTEKLTLEFVPANGSKFQPSTMDTPANILIKAKSTTTLSASTTTPTVGSPVTLTAKVSPNDAAGKVEFYDVTGGKNTKLGEGTVNGGTATYTLTPSNTTPVEVEARFVPDTAGTLASTSAKLTISPKTVGTSVALEGDTTFTVGEAGTLTARVTPDNAEGTVEFLDGDTSLGTADVTNGTATLENVTFDADAANKTITVKFTPSNPNFAAHQGSGEIDVMAKKVAADTAITLSGDTAKKFGEQATITATVTADAADGTPTATAPTGNVRFYEGDSLIGTAQVGTDGKATLTDTFPVGEHTIRAEYTPADGSEFNPSETTQNHTLNVTAAQFETETKYTGATEGKKGEPVTLKATVTPKGSEDKVNSGKVVFRNGNTVLATADVNNGVAEAEHTFTLSGTQTVTAVYVPANGDTTYLPSRAADAKVLIKASTTTTLTADENPPIGTPVTLTATVSPQLAQGKVEFWDVTDPANPQKLSGDVNVVNTKATYNYTPQDTTPRTIEARFTPTQVSYNASKSAPVTITGQKQGSTVKLTDSQTFTAGREGTLTARVEPNNAAGKVEFLDRDNGDAKLGEADVNNGIASIKHTFATDGEKNITVKFVPADGSPVAEATNDTGTVNVTKAAADTKITIEVPNADSLTVDDPAKITATVPAGVPGKVRFVVTQDGKDTEIGVKEANGTDTEVTFEGVAAEGTYEVRAEFTPSDTAAHKPSVSNTVNVTVAPKTAAVQGTTTTIEGPAQGKTSTPYTYTATIADADGNPATGGKVEFFSNDFKMGEANVAGDGTASVEYSFVIPGQRDVVAVYTPADGSNLEGSKSAPIKAMMKEDAKVTLAAPTDPVDAGQPVTLTATVTPQLAKGTVEFYDDKGTKLGQAPVENGRATGTITPTAGTNTVEARFVPVADSVYNPGTSAPVDITAKNVDTTVTVTEGQTFEAGVPGDLTARVTPTNAKGEVVFYDNHPETGEYRELRAPLINGTAVLKGIQFESPIETRTVNVKFVPAPGSGFNESSNTGTVKVKVKTPEAADTTLTLTNSENPTADKDTTIFATVTPTNANGIVEIYNQNRELLGTANVTNGRAELPLRLAEGTHNLRGEFIPADATKHKPSSQTLTVTVGKKPEPTPTPTPVDTPRITQAPQTTGEDGKVTLNAKVKAGTKGFIQFLLTDGTKIGSPIAIPDNGEVSTETAIGNKPGAYAIQSVVVDENGKEIGPRSAPVRIVVPGEPATSGSSADTSDGSAKGSSDNEKSSLTGPNRPWIIAGITVAVTALLAGVGGFFLQQPAVKSFLAQFGIRY